MKLRNIDPSIYKILKITRLTKIFDISLGTYRNNGRLKLTKVRINAQLRAFLFLLVELIQEI